MNKIEKIHLIAICGMGMGSLAQLLASNGYKITGSDQHVYPPMSDQLKALGVKIYDGYGPSNLKEKPDLVVVGNAISKNNPEAMEMVTLGLDYCSMPQALGRFYLEGREPIVVVGTHGKTTTCALITWLLDSAGLDPGCFVGGILGNYGGSARAGSGPYFVIEGDEYDTAYFDKGPKFFHYRPKHTILTSIEFDHADIYDSLDQIMANFRKYLALVPPDGTVVACTDDENVRDVLKTSKIQAKVISYGLAEEATWRPTNFVAKDGRSEFDIVKNGYNVGRVESPLPGRHNALNLVGIVALFGELGIGLEQIKDGLMGFKGIKRRQEVRGVVNDIIVIDDFAHHPTAVKETVEAIRASYKGRRLVGIFEPRTATSRRKTFQQKYVQAFTTGLLDHLIVAKPYDQSKISEDQRFSSEKLVADIKKQGKPADYIPTADEIVVFAKKFCQPGDVLLVMSNGGFDGIHDKLLTSLRAKE